jgi:GntR family transcriptional regulator / MocR family aminotransferase
VRRALKLSKRGYELLRQPVRLLTVSGTPQPFASGHPDVASFPIKLCARIIAKCWRQRPHELLDYGDPAGYWPLRHAIADYVRSARAVRCKPEQVVIVNGSQQAIDLITRLLVNHNDAVLLEDPGYPGARSALRAAGAMVLPLVVDEEGADIERVKAHNRRVRLVFVTPSHQYPLGVTMTLQRRLALLDWAQRQSAFIIEDDYDSDYRYRGRPLPALQGLDSYSRVIYMGSFSKTVLPSLRLGFLVLPEALVQPFRSVRASVDGHSPIPEQAVLAEFIAEGHFVRHLRRMRMLYEERQRVLVEAAARELPELLHVPSSDGGMHLVGWLPAGTDDRAVSRSLRQLGLFASPLSACRIEKKTRGALLLGYAAFRPGQIHYAVKQLAFALRKIEELRNLQLS